MNHKLLGWLTLTILTGALVFAGHARADSLSVTKSDPSQVWRNSTMLNVAVIGSGFTTDSVVRFLVAGGDEFGGISVDSMRFLSPGELVAHVKIDSAVVPGAFDIEVQDALGEKARATSAITVKPYTWAARFGCTGAEPWRRRIPCRRGTIY